MKHINLFNLIVWLSVIISSLIIWIILIKLNLAVYTIIAICLAIHIIIKQEKGGKR